MATPFTGLKNLHKWWEACGAESNLDPLSCFLGEPLCLAVPAAQDSTLCQQVAPEAAVCETATNESCVAEQAAYLICGLQAFRRKKAILLNSV